MRILVPLKAVSAFLASWMLLFASSLYACSVPVFRYALQRWETEPYDVIVFHRGPFSTQDQAVLDRLNKDPLDEQYPANLHVQTVDLAAQPEAGLLHLYQALPREELPCMAVMYPQTSLNADPVWSGRLSHSAVQALVDSPARREIARRILEGESAVWVLVESGKKEKDDAAARLLQTQLAGLEKTLVIPSLANDVPETAGQGALDNRGAPDPTQPQSNPPLRPSFSLVRISRKSPAERIFVSMLIESEPDLKEYAEHPIAFPVFGRGRVLYALVGRGINKDNIDEACMFLCGPCFCEFKAENQGTDLLMAVDWGGAVEDEPILYAPLPPLTGVLPLPMSKQADEHPSEEKSVAAAAIGSREESGWLFRNVLIAFAGAVAFVVMGTVLIRHWAKIKRR